MKLYIIQQDTLLQSQYTQLLELVSAEKRERVLQMKNEKSGRMSILGELLMRLAAVRELGIENENINIVKNEFGKPFLENCSDFYTSISHSGNIAACAVDTSEVGLDIELIKDANMRIAKRCFSLNEYEWLLSLREEEQNTEFYKLWTLKESYIKQQGKGFAIPLNSFSFNLIEETERPVIELPNNSGLHFFCDSFSYSKEEYSLSVCSKKVVENLDYIFISAEDIKKIQKR